MAFNLPKLWNLRLTIVASDTSNLKFVQHAFRKLSSLELRCSFMNFDVEGFCSRAAALHISSLLPEYGWSIYFQPYSYMGYQRSHYTQDDERYEELYSLMVDRMSKEICFSTEVRAHERARLANFGLLREENSA